MVDLCQFMNIFIVTPPIRKPDFLVAWENKYNGHNLIIIEDHKTQEIVTPRFKNIPTKRFMWRNIHADLGKNEWIFSRRNDVIRYYGFWKIHEMVEDVIVAPDDDCYPVKNKHVSRHIYNLSLHPSSEWFTTSPYPQVLFSCGFSYKIRNSFKTFVEFIPKEYLFPTSSMNLALKRQATPYVYYPLEDHPFRRAVEL